MTKALVLDFGGVISKTLFETWPDVEEALQIAQGRITWKGPFDPSTDQAWQDMQADRISERDYWSLRMSAVGELAGRSFDGFVDFIQAVRGDDPARSIRPEALAAISKARSAGCKLAICSNELDLFYGRDLRRKLTFLEDFDCIVDATYTQILKPDPRAYQLVLDELALPAEDCVFVDDQHRNITGAEAIGMQTIHLDVTRAAESFSAALHLLGVD